MTNRALSHHQRQELDLLAAIEANTQQRTALSEAAQALSPGASRKTLHGMTRRLEKDNANLWNQLNATQRELSWEQSVEVPLIDYLEKLAGAWEGQPLTQGMLDTLAALDTFANQCFKAYQKGGPASAYARKMAALTSAPVVQGGKALHASAYYPQAQRRAVMAEYVVAQMVKEMTPHQKTIMRVLGMEHYAERCTALHGYAKLADALVEGTHSRMVSCMASPYLPTLGRVAHLVVSLEVDPAYTITDRELARSERQARKLDQRAPKSTTMLARPRL